MEKYKFSKAGENLVNLMIDHKRNAPLACFASKEGRKEAINAKFFEVLGTSNPSENDLDEHKKEIFAIIREVATQTLTNDGAEVSEFYSRFVDERSLPLGDTLEIEIKNDAYLTVGRISGNNWNLKRERIDKGDVVTIKTDAFYVGVYEYLKRVITKRADFADIMDLVGKSITKHKNDFIYENFKTAIDGLPTAYKYTGAYIEKEILERIAKVKAANKGSRITLVGTAEALALLQGKTEVGISQNMMDEMNGSGFLGTWKGNDCLALPTCYKANTEELAFADNVIYIIPSDQKLVTIVNEGEPIVKSTSLITDNMDMTEDYFVIWRMGAVVIFNKMMGRIELN